MIKATPAFKAFQTFCKSHNMNTQSTTKTVSQLLPSDKRVLSFKGYSAIQLNTYYSRQVVSVFLKENRLLFVREGSIKIRYGKVEYEVCKNQLAFLKKDVLFEYETVGSPAYGEKGEFIIFAIT